MNNIALLTMQLKKLPYTQLYINRMHNLDAIAVLLQLHALLWTNPIAYSTPRPSFTSPSV